MTSTDDASCSDCKMEIIERKWTQLLLNWINRCVSPKPKIVQLDYKTLLVVISKYKHDICEDEADKALLKINDLESFIKYKYPILRLRYLSEEKNIPKRIYIMTSIILYHCCASSQTGAVVNDICCKMAKTEQEWILKFCENLSETETTIYNVECAIKKAYEAVTESMRQSNNSTVNSSRIDKTLSNSENSSKSDSLADRPKSTLKFRSSVTIMPSVVTDLSDVSKSSDMSDDVDFTSRVTTYNEDMTDDVAVFSVQKIAQKEETPVNTCLQNMTGLADTNCPPGCACERCSLSGPCCGDPGSSMDMCNEPQGTEKKNIREYFHFNWKIFLGLAAFLVFGVILLIVLSLPGSSTKKTKSSQRTERFVEDIGSLEPNSAWLCKKNFCQKVYRPTKSTIYFTSLSRCTLVCMGPQLWPHPIGFTHFSKKLVFISTHKLEYKFQSLPSEIVHQYLAEAFKLFLGDLARLERRDVKRHHTEDIIVKKMNIQIHVESDPEPRLKLNTEETYTVKVESTKNQVVITVKSPSFCGVRHGLETLSQMILLDQSTGYLITLTNALVRDSPSYKYRGLMIDTARNYIPVNDLMRTIDAMAACKLNTFHWRITDATSFPLIMPELPHLLEYGAYDRSLVYTAGDIKAIVQRAGIRGIRVVIEVAAPGPVGRPWSWLPEASCPKKNDNITCDNVLCLRLQVKDLVFDILQIIYTYILDLTMVDDVFHLSDGIFSLSNCYNLIEEREGFLDKALERLKLANKGFLPNLPIIWYTTHLMRDLEAKTWDRLGVQMYDWVQNPDEQFMSRFKVIHSSKWDLSCEFRKQRCIKYRTWQEMYAWKSWRTIEAFAKVGGEAMLWTDLVDSGNLDYHLWPRAAAVAERLWSDLAANSSANGYTYVRLDAQRKFGLVYTSTIFKYSSPQSKSPSPLLKKLVKIVYLLVGMPEIRIVSKTVRQLHNFNTRKGASENFASPKEIAFCLDHHSQKKVNRAIILRASTAEHRPPPQFSKATDCVCIQCVPAIFTRSSVHLVGGRSTLRF